MTLTLASSFSTHASSDVSLLQAPALLLATIQGLYQGQDRGATIEVECRRPLSPAEHAISTCISLARSSEEALMPITLPHGATCAELHLEAPPAETSTSSCLLPQVALLHASPLNVNDFCLFFGGAMSVRPVHVRKGLTPPRRQGISSSSTSRSNKLASRTGLAWTSTSTPPQGNNSQRRLLSPHARLTCGINPWYSMGGAQGDLPA